MLEEIFISSVIITICTAIAGVINFFVEFSAWEAEQEAKRAKRFYNVVKMEKYRKSDVKRLYV